MEHKLAVGPQPYTKMIGREDEHLPLDPFAKSYTNDA